MGKMSDSSSSVPLPVWGKGSDPVPAYSSPRLLLHSPEWLLGTCRVRVAGGDEGCSMNICAKQRKFQGFPKMCCYTTWRGV